MHQTEADPGVRTFKRITNITANLDKLLISKRISGANGEFGAGVSHPSPTSVALGVTALLLWIYINLTAVFIVEYQRSLLASFPRVSLYNSEAHPLPGDAAA